MKNKMMMKMTKIKISVMMLVICILVATMGAGAGVYAGVPTNSFFVTYNGNLVTFLPGEGNFYIDSENRTQCPARKISETMSYNVAWDAKARKVTISGNDTEIILTVGSNTALVNGKEVKLDTTVYLKASEGRVYLPVRFITENMGCTVVYARQNNVNVIKITSKNGAVVSASTIEGFNQLTKADGAKMLDNMELIASLVPADNVLMDKDASGGRVMYNPVRTPQSISDGLVIVTSAVGNECDVIIKPKTWTVPGLEKDKDVIACVNFTRETLKTYLPQDWKVIFDAFDSRKTDRTKTYICDNRAVRIAGNEILIGFIGQKTIAGK